MEKRIIEYLLILVLILLGSVLRANANFTGIPGERLYVVTDRMMYIAGEKIWFSAFLSMQDASQDYKPSSIMYCELITPDGNSILKGKFLIHDSSSEGCMPIPEKCITGIYYLKSYTRLMRNGNPGDYSYIMLKIINPLKAEVLAGQGDSVPVFNTDSIPAILKNGTHLVRLASGKISYQPGEQILFQTDGILSTGLASKLTLSIVPKAALEFMQVDGNKCVLPLTNEHYFSENQGVSLSGRAMIKGSRQPLQGIKINLSIIGDRDIMAVRTDSSGRFFFALPDHEGSRDIFLCAENQPGISSEIYIDNDFCTRPVKLPSPVFSLSREEKETAYKLAVNSRLTDLFDVGEVVTDTVDTQVHQPFYGKPIDILSLDYYISLPTMEDFFRELPVMVQVRKSHGQRYFRYLYPQAEMLIYDPLVLIDWVAVDDIERLLAVSPLKIDRIEFVNTPYVKGNITYGGIISFISKENDFAGIDLPASGTFINYSFLESCTGKVPDDQIHGNHPDSRNTVYWNPDVKLKDSGKSEISVYAPGTPGKYLAVLRGMNSNGEMIFQSLEFEVKQ